MSYTLNVEQRSNYLYITVTGDNTVDSVQGYLAEVRDLCLQYKCPNVLLVENLAGPGLDTFHIYDLVSRNSPQTVPLIGRIAFVDINPAHNPKNMEFAEDVAVNRGVTVKVFSTLKEAEEWLGQEVNPKN